MGDELDEGSILRSLVCKGDPPCPEAAELLESFCPRLSFLWLSLGRKKVRPSGCVSKKRPMPFQDDEDSGCPGLGLRAP